MLALLLFPLTLLLLLLHDVQETFKNLRVLVVDTSRHREVFELERLTHQKESDGVVYGWRYLSSTNKHTYLVVEEPSPASRSMTCLRTS